MITHNLPQSKKKRDRERQRKKHKRERKIKLDKSLQIKKSYTMSLKNKLQEMLKLILPPKAPLCFFKGKDTTMLKYSKKSFFFFLHMSCLPWPSSIIRKPQCNLDNFNLKNY